MCKLGPDFTGVVQGKLSLILESLVVEMGRHAKLQC